MPFFALIFVSLLLVMPWPATAEETTTHGVSLFGAFKYPPDFEHFEYVNPAAPKGGEITLASIGTFDSLNPYIMRGVGADNLGWLYDTLLVSAQDEASTEYGLLAESVTRPDDNSWVEFTLRSNARWHDGVPVTVADVLFSFEALTTKGRPHFRAYYSGIKSAEKTGERTVRFTFHDPSNRELALIIGQLPILPKHYYDTVAFDEPTLEPPLGSGPYRVEAVDPGRSLTFARVEDYWAKDLPVNKGRYNFDRIQVDYYRDETVAVEALKAGEYDFRQENISRIWSTNYDIDAVREGRLVKRQIEHEIPTGMQAFFFNTRRAKFADPRVRQALALAYDFEWANEHLFYGMYERNRSYFGNSPLASSGLPSEEELALLEPFRDQLPEAVFAEAYTPPVYSDAKAARGYLLQARDLLREAGWEVKDGVLTHTESGEVMQVEFLIVSKAFERIIGPYLKNLERLGVQGSIRLVDSAQYQKRLERFEFDMITYLYGQSLSPGNEQIYYWHSEQAEVEGSRNFTGIRHPAVDAMIAHILAAQDYAALTTACRALDRILLHQHIAVPQWHIRSFQILHWDKFGYPEVRPKYGLGFPDSWWFDQEKAITPGSKED